MLHSRLRYWLLAIAALQVSDLGLTLYGLIARPTAVFERNPLGSSIVVILIMKAVALALVPGVVVWADQHGSGWLRAAFRILPVVVGALIVSNNLAVLLITR